MEYFANTIPEVGGIVVIYSLGHIKLIKRKKMPAYAVANAWKCWSWPLFDCLPISVPICLLHIITRTITVDSVHTLQLLGDKQHRTHCLVSLFCLAGVMSRETCQSIIPRHYSLYVFWNIHIDLWFALVELGRDNIITYPATTFNQDDTG